MIERTNTAPHSAAAAYGDVGLRRYMLRVYNLMAMGIGLSGVIAYFTISNAALINFVIAAIWPLLIGAVILGFVAPRIILAGRLNVAHLVYWSYCALWGLLLAPFVLAYTNESVARVFFITSATFAGLSLYGYSTKRDLRPMASFLAMAMIGLVIALVVNLFIQLSGFHLLLSVGVVIVVAGITAYQTQAIRQSYFHGDSAHSAEGKAIFGALQLYGSFLTLFIYLLSIFGQRR